MSHVSWIDVWNVLLSAWAGESSFLQIVIGLGILLVAVLFLEGLYASLRPLRYAARIARNYPDNVAMIFGLGEARENALSMAIAYADAGSKGNTLHVGSGRRLRPAMPKVRRSSMVNPPPGTAKDPTSTSTPPA
jgi:hypothetical protein